MIALFLISTLFAIICYRYDPKSKSIRWGVLLLICAALAGLSRAIIESIIPALNKDNMNFHWLNWMLYYLRIITGFISVYFFPWGVLMHAITYSEKFNSKTEKILTYVLFIPIPFMLKTTVYVPDLIPDFQSMLYWAVPYICFACLLNLYAYFTEKDQRKKKNRFTTLSIILPVILSALILNYIDRAFDSTHQYWRYMIVFLVFAFVVFLWKALQEGAGSLNGIKLRYEREARQHTMKAVTSGTAFLNHTIKNEMAKINFLVNQIKEHVPLDKTSSESIDLALDSTNHVLELSTRIQNKLDIMNLKESEFWISHSIDSAISLLQPYLNSKINIIKQFEVDVKIYGDPVHIQETFLNIIKNAIEAMEDSGVILIKVYKIRRNVYIDLIDNGKGIEKDKLSLVLNPFYSTKGSLGNFGLGLTYCYKVIEKHGGDISMKSQINQGTTITLSLPPKRIMDIKINQQSHYKSSGANSYGKN